MEKPITLRRALLIAALSAVLASVVVAAVCCRYQIHAGPDYAWRLDRWTGRAWVAVQGEWKEYQESAPTLASRHQ